MTELSFNGDRAPTINSIAVSLDWTRERTLRAVKAANAPVKDGRIPAQYVTAVVAAGAIVTGHP